MKRMLQRPLLSDMKMMKRLQIKNLMNFELWAVPVPEAVAYNSGQRSLIGRSGGS